MISRVLIVDDHPTFRASARRLLEAEGFAVVGEAGDGAAALAKLGLPASAGHHRRVLAVLAYLRRS